MTARQNPLARVPNPFGNTVVRDAWLPAAIDVPSIHGAACMLCLSLFEQVASGSGSESILIHGPAGSGKTHLLGRLQRRLVEGARTAPDGALRGIFVSIKLQTSPQMLWQHLRRQLADDLMRVHEGASQLQRLMAHDLAKADPERKSPRAWVSRIRILSQLEDPELDALFEAIDARARFAHDLRVVLRQLVSGRMVTDARAWLRGDSLPELVLERLGLSRDTAHDQDPEYAAQDVVLSICRLAGPTLPLVLCFDQIEALQSHRQDVSAFFKLGGLIASLFNSTEHVLLIACIQSAMLDLLRDNVREADRDRLARRESVLDPLSREEAMLLLDRRLDSVPELAALRRAHPAHPHWPIQTDHLAPLFEEGDTVTARRVLYFAEGVFERLQKGAGGLRPPPDLGGFLEAEFDERYHDALVATQPADSEGLLRHAVPLLAEVTGTWRIDPEYNDLDVDLRLVDASDRIEISVCCHQNMTRLARRLRRLSERRREGRLVLLRDPRLPISASARKTRSYLEVLETQGVQLLTPPLETLAGLHALRSILCDAQSGDLENGAVTLAPQAVRAWLAEHLDARLLGLMETIVGNAAPELLTAIK